MPYTSQTLIDKIRQLYPTLRDHSIEVVAWRDEEQGTWVITLRKGDHTLTTYLDTVEADQCIESNRCLYLGLHVAEFLANFEDPSLVV
ncbi:MAG: hypothetical protein COW73_06985 [Nitrospirae bacterium CG18_big_fil_WC_8_21_14_2_50_70_55]|nr:hypothetical protein [Deltaproteobacteria bacterium]OIP67203.1 MAG: hypothetical protein AUK30_01050 [Nitrospirae bacterium CG2_30_70_394]PIQ04878.1 MAG: hypothetical protein COW73_06985 [Nitrospirae bacterium CG18_big_fil_WC_8_21_14_2_50_70_55]PIU78104.1 MAG: hypothetical protein COS73_08155 [Nitrospirae bacterium CG06_land_8_20_14_3_00_70_43]PIW82159.1 MAG: hypothetical protein COZ96_10160 [Nitrospirae bacterium CG_4_8_14_3_um_filter_70_85]PIX83423.1 MAG: hypothetical protein COZ33_05430 